MSSGTYTGQTDYSAFGEVIGGNNTGASQSVYQWGAQSGYRMDGGSGGGGDCGLVKVGARYYDPAVGRFTSRDSDMGQELSAIPNLAGLLDDLPALGHNAYGYCGGDPVNATDPSGHKRTWWQKLLATLGLGTTIITGQVHPGSQNPSPGAGWPQQKGKPGSGKPNSTPSTGSKFAAGAVGFGIGYEVAKWAAATAAAPETAGVSWGAAALAP